MSTTRTCSVSAHTRRLPEKKCSIDNAIHTRLRDEVNCERAAIATCHEIEALLDDPIFQVTCGIVH